MAGGSEQMIRKGCITCSREFGGEVTLCPHDGTRLTPLSEADLIGTVLDGRYEVTEVIGGGGMGLVYKARHSFMHRTVAIKVLHKHMITNTDALKRFRLEAEAVSCLNVPNILTVYDFGVSRQGQPYMVMDYLEGTSLGDVLDAEQSLEVDRSLNIFIQICRALEHAHEKSVIHRDLKPSNIMLLNVAGQNDFVKIVDFGIAKLLGRAEGEVEQLTRTGEVFGSPLYMSPEQCRGKTLDYRTDIYSLGSVMYQTVTGKPLFAGDDVFDLFFKQVSEKPIPFEAVCPELKIPKRLEQTIFQTLEKEAADRIQSMKELRLILEEIQRGRSEPESSQIAPGAQSNGERASSSAQLSPAITTGRNNTSTTTSLRPPIDDEADKSLAQRPIFAMQGKLVVLACAILFFAILALTFFLGRNEAIIEESKQHKEVAPQVEQTKVNPAPVLQQTLTPDPPVTAKRSEAPAATSKTPSPKISKPAEIGEHTNPVTQGRSTARKKKTIARNVTAGQSAQSSPATAIAEPPVAPQRPPAVDQPPSSSTSRVVQETDVQQSAHQGEDRLSSALWSKMKKDEAVRHKLFKKAIRIFKDSLNE
jgi:serine/threonine protein kinase